MEIAPRHAFWGLQSGAFKLGQTSSPQGRGKKTRFCFFTFANFNKKPAIPDTAGARKRHGRHAIQRRGFAPDHNIAAPPADHAPAQRMPAMSSCRHQLIGMAEARLRWREFDRPDAHHHLSEHARAQQCRQAQKSRPVEPIKPTKVIAAMRQQPIGHLRVQIVAHLSHIGRCPRQSRRGQPQFLKHICRLPPAHPLILVVLIAGVFNPFEFGPLHHARQKRWIGIQKRP